MAADQVVTLLMLLAKLGLLLLVRTFGLGAHAIALGKFCATVAAPKTVSGGDLRIKQTLLYGF